MVHGPCSAVVTGAAGGIGGGVVHALAGDGYAVEAVDRSQEGLADLCGRLPAGGAGVTPRLIDLSVREADARLAGLAEQLEKSGRPLTALVTCAGVGGWNAVEDVTVDEWDAIVDTNLRGTFLTCRHLVPLLRRQPGSTVVIAASDSADHGFPRRTAYCASKYGRAHLA